MIEMISRGQIQDPAVAREFEHLISRLRGFLSQSFDADGQLIVADPNLAVVPVGGILPYGGTTAPLGFLLCDGSAVNRVSYKALLDAIGTTYGAGDGSTTFNVPDLRQRFPLGKAASGTGATLGGTGGAIDHTHSFSATSGNASAGQFVSSAAPNDQNVASNPGHTHSVSGTTGTGNAPFLAINYVIFTGVGQ